MNLGSDLAAVVLAPGGASITCVLHVGEARIPARMVLTRGGTNKGGVSGVLGWATGAELPTGADWAVALLLAESLPFGTGVDVVETVDDQLGTLWRVEGATPLTDTIGSTVDGQNLTAVVGWRLALRGTQRGVR